MTSTDPASREPTDISSEVSQLKTVHFSLMAAALVVFVAVYISLQDTRIDRAAEQLDVFGLDTAATINADASWALEIATDAWRKEESNFVDPRVAEAFRGWVERSEDGTPVEIYVNHERVDEALFDVSPGLSLADAVVDMLYVGIARGEPRFLISDHFVKSSWGIDAFECHAFLRSKFFKKKDLDYVREWWKSLSRLKFATLGPDLTSDTFSLAIFTTPKGEEAPHPAYIWLDDVRINTDDFGIDEAIVREVLSRQAEPSEGTEPAQPADTVETAKPTEPEDAYIPLRACILDKERRIPPNHALRPIEHKLDRSRDILYLSGELRTRNTVLRNFADVKFFLFAKTNVSVIDGRRTVARLIGIDSNLIGTEARDLDFEKVFPDLDVLIHEKLHESESIRAEIERLKAKKEGRGNRNEEFSAEDGEKLEALESTTTIDRIEQLISALDRGEARFPRQSADAIDIQGVHIHVHDIAFLGALYIVFHQLYFFVHFKGMVNGVRAIQGSVKTGPWIGIYDDFLSRALTIATTGLFPLGICIWVLTYSAGGGGDQNFINAVSMSFGFEVNSFTLSRWVLAAAAITSGLILAGIYYQQYRLMADLKAKRLRELESARRFQI